MTAEKKANPFELIVGEADGEIHSGDVPVRWCLTPEYVKELDEQGIVDPHILLVSTHFNEKISDTTEMQRQLVPVGELMTYVRFTRSGKMALHGWIVDGAYGRKDLHKRWITKIDGHYATDLFYTNTGEAHDLIQMERAVAYTSTDVIIPAGVFGKEPRPAIKWYVNMWHGSRIVDECHFRRRMVLAFTLKWIPFFLWTTILVAVRVLVAAGFTMAGWRTKTHWKYVLRPYKYPFEMVVDPDDLCWEDCEYIWWRKAKYKNMWGEESTYEVIHFTGLAINPLIVTIYWLIVLAANNGHEFGAMSVASYRTLQTVLILAIILLITDLGHWRYLVNHNVLENYRYSGAAIAIVAIPIVAYFFLWQWVFTHASLSEEDNDMTEIRELLCPADSENLMAKYKAIPRQRRTIRLWYLDMKNKVCKPMQH